MFGINGGELLVLLVLVALVIGPERLPPYAQQLGRWTRDLRALIRDTKTRVGEEIGGDLDWESFDPRQYDPRRIVRDALQDPQPTPPSGPTPRWSTSASLSGATDGKSSAARSPSTDRQDESGASE